MEVGEDNRRWGWIPSEYMHSFTYNYKTVKNEQPQTSHRQYSEITVGNKYY